MKRLSWDDYGMALAEAAALRGDCRRTQVGAFILAADHHFVGGGYNGVDPGEAGCLDGACPRGLLSVEEVAPLSDYENGPGRCISRHAEANALLFTNRSEREGGTIYVTYQPCPACMKLIRGSGVDRAVWPEGEWTRKVVAGGGTQEAQEELVGSRADGSALEAAAYWEHVARYGSVKDREDD